MDESENVIENFERHLRNQKSAQRLTLYRSTLMSEQISFKPQDVINTVYSQIRALQQADCVKNGTKGTKHLAKVKTNFLPVNKLPMYGEISKPTASKFETQGFSDTQLINVIEHVEAVHPLMHSTGMTQEFDTTFAQNAEFNSDNVKLCNETYVKQHSDNMKTNSKEKDNNINEIQRENDNEHQKYVKDNVLNAIDTDMYKLSIENTRTNLLTLTETVDEINGIVLNSINPSGNKDTQNLKTLTQSQDIFITQDVDKDVLNDCEIDIDTGQIDNNIAPSPVLQSKTKMRNSKISFPLTVSLESFEKFEIIAFPIIEETTDTETAKHLINSQILEKELCLNTYADILSFKIHHSPILELDSDEMKVNTCDINSQTIRDKPSFNEYLGVNKFKEEDSGSFKDEILFSSDEETDYYHKCYQDLPLTCALDASFYNKIDVLDKTMYVGFQTASSKSIQICTESFEKARSLLDDVSQTNDKIKEISLTELVEKCTNLNNTYNTVSTKMDNCSASKAVDILENPIHKLGKVGMESNSKSDNVVDNQTKVTNNNKRDDTTEITLEQRIFQGFTTPNKKKVTVSEKTWENCMNIFKDINLSDKFEAEEVTYKFFKETNNNKDNILVENGANIGDKINDENILQEFENIEMSLEDKISETNDEDNKDINIEICDIKCRKHTHEKEAERTEMTPQCTEIKDTINKHTVETREFIGFKTASDKNINVSAKSLAKMKNIFQDIDLQSNEVEVLYDMNQPSTSKAVFAGFKTANNKDIKISEKAMESSKKVFEFINPEINPSLNKSNYEDQQWKKSSSKCVFLGFKTENNNNIKISKTALLKTKNVFKNINNEVPIERETPFKEFPVFNNKNVSVSQEPLLKSKYICQDQDSNDEGETGGSKFESNVKYEEDKVKLVDNLGASLIKNVIETNIRPEKKLYPEHFMQEHLPIDDDLQKIKSPLLKGFHTASNKLDKRSHEAFSKSIKIFDNINKGEDLVKQSQKFTERCTDKESNSNSSNHQIENVLANFVGFKTASNKNVKISETALAKSKKIFDDIGDYPIIDKTPMNAHSKTPKEYKFQGFKTASNKNVDISKEALQKTKNIFDNINNFKNKSIEFSCDGFQTASNKKVSVSEYALAKSKQLFHDINKHTDCKGELENDIFDNNKPTKTFGGFLTASNKKVAVSEQALAKSKQLFQDIEIEIDKTIDGNSNLENEAGSNNKQAKTSFSGFQTASNKKVELSEQALIKSKHFTQDFDGDRTKENHANDDLDSVKNNELTQITFGGFQTASNKKVAVSEQALMKSKELFQDINKKTKEYINNNNMSSSEVAQPITSSFSFMTASNKGIQISEEALKESKKVIIRHNMSGPNKSLEVENKLKNETIMIKDFCKEVKIDEILNTQVLNNFEETLCTEDFKESPRKNKRSGSPILSCPRAKRKKKFKTPYSNCPKTLLDFTKTTEIVNKNPSTTIFRKDYKQNKVITLKNLADLDKNTNQTIDPYIMNFNLENILDFEFNENRNELTDTKINIDNLKRRFIDATDKKLIPEGWLDNHLRLILWKLISYEVRFPNVLGIVCTVQNVIDQLKYRYDRELYCAERSAIRKIFEKDDVSTKSLVLCVAGIYQDGVSVASATNHSNLELLLTDGWYCVKATIDKMLTKLVFEGKIVVGCKIFTNGAELVNCDQGVAPWEDTSAIRLKLFGNSTRLARWDTKLGYHRAAILNQLSTVNVDGGKVCRLKVFVTRVYPLLYVEKFGDGSTVTRSERLEHLHQIKYESERDSMIEKIYEEVEKEFSDMESQESGGSTETSKRKCYDSGSQIAKMMKKCRDPMEFRAQLTSSQVQMLQDHTSKQRDKYLETIQDRIREKLSHRNVVTLARGRIAGIKKDGGHFTVCKGMLSIWKPSEAVLEMFKEGHWIEILNVVPTAIRYSEIQISAGRQSVFKPTTCKNETHKPYFDNLKRICFEIRNLSENPTMATDYNEIDTVGLIFSIEPSNREFVSTENQFQNMYLADADKNLICVNFWGGIKKFGYVNVLDTGQVIYCANLQRRAGNTRRSIPQYRVTEFTYFTKTPRNEQARQIIEDLNKKLYGLDKRKFCEDCLAVKMNYSVLKCFSDNENRTPCRFNKSDYSLIKNKMFIDTPVGVKVNKQDDFNLSGLDFESTFKLRDTEELSPKTLRRKRIVNDKIARLKMYGEPPPLSHINIINKSKIATSSYKSPLNTKHDNCDLKVAINKNETGVATPQKLRNTNTISSPVLCVNRKFVKRNVNPVKLDFCENINKNNVDPFEEEFDGSPPMSLE